MPRFRKKPIEIEARELTEAKAGAVAAWCGGRTMNEAPGRCPTIEIDTLEGVMTASPGDWIIRGVSGEFYPCKPDIFEATYDQVELTPADLAN